jgi:translation initiation factor IF-2
MGFEDVPTVGSQVRSKQGTQTALTSPMPTAVAKAFPSAVEIRKLPLIIKTDTQGSLEAISQSLPMDDVEVLTATTGEPTEADVLLAAPSNALIIGFNVKPGGSASRLAENEGVIIKSYKLIYELLEELTEVIALYKEGKEQEVVLGMAEVVALFPFDKKMVAGSKILEGRMVRGDKIKIERDGQTIGETRISSLRVGKQDIGKVEEGSECGILLSSNLDIQPHDVILSVR